MKLEDLFENVSAVKINRKVAAAIRKVLKSIDKNKYYIMKFVKVKQTDAVIAFSEADANFRIEVFYNDEDDDHYFYIDKFNMGSLKGKGLGGQFIRAILQQLPDGTMIKGRDMSSKKDDQTFWQKLAKEFSNLEWKIVRDGMWGMKVD